MTGLAVTFADPERAMIDRLVAAFAGRPEVYKPATITTNFPAAVLAGDVTHVQVELEAGNPDDYPATERAQVRLTCYSAPGKRSHAKNLASLAQALAISHPGGADVLGVLPAGVGRSSVVEDPDTGNLMVWLLVRVALKPVAVA